MLATDDSYGGMKNPTQWKNYVEDQLIGFRAPLLGRNNSMYKALAAKGYIYDTSRVRNMNFWPQKSGGVWDFPLASLRMAYSKKKTLSMDYNLYVAQSKGKKGNPANFDNWENEVFDTYLKYFKSNYLGNRAPLDIGHHFSLWNGGIYWRAMKRFAQEVCHLPEVICGTYTDLVNFLDDQSSSELKAYQAGDFPKMTGVSLPVALTKVSVSAEEVTPFSKAELLELESQACPPEAHLDDGIEEEIVPDGVYL